MPLLTSLGMAFFLCAWLWLHPWGLLGRDDPAGLERKHQARPIPTVGLLVPTLGLLLVGGLPLGSALCLALMALLGWIDDRQGSRWPWTLKLATQIAALALFLIWLGPYATEVRAESSVFGHALLLLGVSWLILTAWNLYDNFDGALAWTALASLGSLLWIGTGPVIPPLLPALAGGLVGFVLFNWPGARLYLGDAGSQVTGFALLLLGFALASTTSSNGEPMLLHSGSSSRLLPWLLLPHLVPLLDLCQVVLGRLLRGKAPWIGDRRHLAHLVHGCGCPAALVAPLLALVQFGAAALGRLAFAS